VTAVATSATQGSTRAESTGWLGADYEVANGRYRLRKVYEGLNWDPQVRAPLTEPGVNAKAGEYILAVNGKELRPPTNIYSLFENTPGRIVELTLGPNADGRARASCRERGSGIGQPDPQSPSLIP
jgi:hypothetical protein